MNYVVESYENYKEEDRLTTNKSRQVEFITTVRAFNEVFPASGKLLDCGAGTGIYSFYYGDMGYEVTALDITPRHINIINQELKNKGYHMDALVNDATDLSLFDDETFDVVLCMGPLYHLTDRVLREKCLAECIRVLKKGGLLAVSYISRFYMFPHIASSDKKYLNMSFGKKLIDTGVINHEDPDCFWTDSYYYSPDEIENDFNKFNIKIVDHLAADGISPLLRDKVNSMNDEEYKIWCDYHYAVCREKSILGASNHGLIIGRK
ncbi:class I SAM-dependent methyltransferase [Alloiococcus sp. CFN-8]|uniref:class I SAM-dependent methyltransferase n=1 Tax=Alloiococcus sp. CFN-8 TaxID=3416081 RepID=UPI003CF35E00